MNRTHRHIPTLIDSLTRRIDLYKQRISFYEDKKYKQEENREKYFMKIFEIKQDIKISNFDLEAIEDPISKPLGTGQEQRKVETLIRRLESKVKRLESNLLNLQSKVLRAEMLIDDSDIHINALREKYLGYEHQVDHYRKILIDNMFKDDGEYLDREPAIDVEFKATLEG